jgi:hypothetical protein
MRKTFLTIFGALLIAGSAVQIATASEHHARKAHQERSNYRGAYDQFNGPPYAAPLTSGESRNLEDFGFSGRDPSRVGGVDPSLRPSGS